MLIWGDCDHSSSESETFPNESPFDKHETQEMNKQPCAEQPVECAEQPVEKNRVKWRRLGAVPKSKVLQNK